MAQTRRKRQTKHRGNAAGVVESRGRTGRKPTAAEKSTTAREATRVREDRRDRPPTWSSAFKRALVAALLMLVAMIVLLGNIAAAFVYFVFVLLLYVPLSFYTDQWVYNRRQRKKAVQASGRKAGS